MRADATSTGRDQSSRRDRYGADLEVRSFSYFEGYRGNRDFRDLCIWRLMHVIFLIYLAASV